MHRWRTRSMDALDRLRALWWWRPRRPLLPSLALLVALCFAFAEPLACIAHCQLYTPWLLRGQQHHTHARAAHVHTAPGGAAALARPAPGSSFTDAAPSTASAWCFYAARQPAAPGAVVPSSPVHELVLALVLGLGALARLRFLPRRAVVAHTIGGLAPPTPPPRLALPSA